MSVFKKVLVYFIVEGGTRVEWELDRQFCDPEPHSYTLQVTNTSTPTADDWEDVGTSVNTFFAIDDEKRVFGKSPETHYRVLLTTPKSSYISGSASIFSGIDHREWRLIREIIRQEKKKVSKYVGAYEAYILKRRRFGTPCSCLDPMTEEVTDPNCATCNGTGFINGYFSPTIIHIDLGNETYREHRDQLKAVGTTKNPPPNIKSTIVGFPLPNSKDVIVEKRTDRRWFVETIIHTSTLRSYPIKADIELRLAPYSDKIYEIQV